jgi:hypothetical protein
MSDTARRRRNKHMILDQAKLRKAQKILGAGSESETIERALSISL